MAISKTFNFAEVMDAHNYKIMSNLLRETESQHALAEKRLPAHDWQDWYAAYMVNRMRGQDFNREHAAVIADDAVTADLAAKAGVTIIDGEQEDRKNRE